MNAQQGFNPLSTEARSLRAALDQLDDVRTALSAVADLVVPSDDLSCVDRDNLAGLFSLLQRLQAQARQSASGHDQLDELRTAMVAVADLTVPEDDLHCVNRDSLAVLLALLSRLLGLAVRRAFEGLATVGQEEIENAESAAAAALMVARERARVAAIKRTTPSRAAERLRGGADGES